MFEFFYFHAEDLYGVCAFDDRNNRTLTYEISEIYFKDPGKK